MTRLWLVLVLAAAAAPPSSAPAPNVTPTPIPRAAPQVAAPEPHTTAHVAPIDTITLTIRGAADQTGAATSFDGTLDFGMINPHVGEPRTGERIRVTDGHGAHFVATLVATVGLDGPMPAPNATMDLYIRAVGGDATGGVLRAGPGLRTPWATSADAGVELGPLDELVGRGLKPGEPFVHQISLYLPDGTTAPQRAEIRYTVLPSDL